MLDGAIAQINLLNAFTLLMRRRWEILFYLEIAIRAKLKFLWNFLYLLFSFGFLYLWCINQSWTIGIDSFKLFLRCTTISLVWEDIILPIRLFLVCKIILMNRTDIRFLKHILTGPFILFQKFASAIDLSWSFPIFVVHFAENFHFFVWFLSPFLKAIIDHLLHPLWGLIISWFFIIFFALRFVNFFWYWGFIQLTDFVALKILSGPASFWAKLVFGFHKKLICLCVVLITMRMNRHSLAFSFWAAQLFRSMIERWSSVKKRSALILNPSLAEINMNSFWVSPETIGLKKAFFFCFSQSAWRKIILRADGISNIRILE